MSEMYNPNEEAMRQRVELIANEPGAIEAIRDTWLFMTGDDMPDSVIEEAHRRAAESPQSEDLWQLKFLVQSADPVLKTPLGKVFVRSALGVVHTDDITPNSEMPHQDPFCRELVGLLGERILDTAYLACGEAIEATISETKCAIAATDDPYEATRLITLAIGPYVDAFRSTCDGVEAREAILKDSEGNQINHIVKLSPQTVALDSDHRFVPSCLSVSIIIASFLKQVGVDEILHAGVLADP